MRSHLLAAMLMLVLSAAHVEAEIRIATVGPMTGARAWSGEQFRRGARLAVEDINAKGGVLGQQLVLVVGDDFSDPEQATAVARKLVADDVVMVAGHRTSGASIAASPVYAEAGVIQISPSATNPRLTEQGFDNVFRVCGRDDQQGAVAADYLAENWRHGRIGIIHDGSAYGRGLAEQTRKRLNERGVAEVVYHRYDPGQKDYSGLVSKLRATRIEVLYVGGYSTEAGLIMRQAWDQDYKIQLVSGDALHNTDFWMMTEEAGENARFTFGADPRATPAAQQVVESLRAADYEPEGYTLHTYAAIQVWAQAVERADSFDTADVIEALHGNEFATVLGPLRFDPKGDITAHSFVWYQWQDGEYRPVH